MWNRVGLCTRLILIGVALQSLTVLVLTWNGAHLIRSSLEQQIGEQVARDRQLLVAALAAPIVQRDYATVQDIIRELATDRSLDFISVHDSSGRLIATAGKAPEDSTSMPASSPLAAPTTPWYDAPVVIGGQDFGRVSFAVSNRLIEETQEALVRRTVAVGIVTLLILVIVLVSFHYILMRPLVRLTVAAERIRAGNYDVDTGHTGGGEIGKLNLAFSHMAQEINRRVADLEEARQRAEAASHAKSTFLAKMSHELRTPMTGVLGMADLLTYTQLDEKQQHYLRLIRSSGDAMLALVNDVLDISRIQAGKLTLVCEDFDPGALVDDIAHLFAPQAKSKGLHLEYSIEGGVPRAILGDPTRFRQILTNLVANAVKFTETGQVMVTLELWANPADTPHLGLRVTDTGIGIPEEARSRIFEPFEQADNSTTRRYEGSGLGLAIVQRLVDAMGGRLEIDSKVGSGTTVGVRLPLNLAPDDNPPRMVAADPSGAS
jgi:two-component system, sensor histidine kinase